MSGRSSQQPKNLAPPGAARALDASPSPSPSPTVSGEYRITTPRTAGRELGRLELDSIAPQGGRLELECLPSSHHAARVPQVDPRSALVAFAGFGDPPASLWQTPSYAVRVYLRRRELQALLVRSRALRPQDVSLYEAALDAADRGAARRGVIVVLAAAIAVVIVAQTLWFGVLPLSP